MPIEVVVPPLGATVDTFTLVAWYKQEGEFVEKDELLFAVETDKATLDVEAPASGILRNISAKPGEEVTALSRIALIEAPGEYAPLTGEAEEQNGNSALQSSIRYESIAHSDLSIDTRIRIFISPRAKRLAEESLVDWRLLKGTGPGGAIVERDVRSSIT
jgi:pyruvate dehydrogenase E2 component (dihydrolipoamide acetyltransferase)